MGEKLEDLEPFYPDRMASRILGMGDVLSLVEKAQAAFDENQAKELEKKMRSQEFDLDDFLNQLQQIKKMGPIKDLMKMIPGLGGKINLDEVDIDDNATKHIEAIIQSMTKQERRNPDILNGSRKKRIARGCGRSIQEVNKLLKQFEDMKRMMKQINDMTRGGRKGKFKMPFF
jgi:signal recognition particle subunit SRP54